ncbi:hypothetical protein IFM89_018161 [Coptis chinensis]|uniref:Uncharacterized protein n=1 Tax=Coptis chinensis TaxID=261450 RepID=A0A835LVG6_9MAGN|nr:hypothetical protein IFM89_018161 [Coptis chinensis]
MLAQTEESLHKAQSPIIIKKNSRESLKPVIPLFNSQNPSTSPRQGPLSSYAPSLQIPHHGAFTSAPGSSMSSPSRIPMRGFSPEQIASSTFWVEKPYPDVALLGLWSLFHHGERRSFSQWGIEAWKKDIKEPDEERKIAAKRMFLETKGVEFVHERCLEILGDVVEWY